MGDFLGENCRLDYCLVSRASQNMRFIFVIQATTFYFKTFFRANQCFKCRYLIPALIIVYVTPDSCRKYIDRIKFGIELIVPKVVMVIYYLPGTRVILLDSIPERNPCCLPI